MSEDLPPGFEIQDQLPPGFEVQSDLPPGFQVEAQPSLARRAYDKAGDYLDTGIKAVTAPFEPVGEAIRGARMNEPLQVATAADPRGFRAPSILQKFVPSLRTPEPPSDPIAETYGGLRGITQAVAHLPQGLGAIQAGAQEIERPRTGMDIIPEVGFGLMLGKVGNAPFDAALEAGGRIARPFLRGMPKGALPGVPPPEIAPQAPLALPAPAEGPGFTMMDQPNLANTVESEVYNPATGTTEIVRRPMAPSEMPKPQGATPSVPRETPPPPVEVPPEPAPPVSHVPEIAPNEAEPFSPELPKGFELAEEPAPVNSRITEMASRDRETMQELADESKTRRAAHGEPIQPILKAEPVEAELPKGFQIEEPAAKAPAAPPAEPVKLSVKRGEIPLSPEGAQIEERSAKLLEADPENLVKQYRARYGNVVDADNARELFPDYSASRAARAKNSAAVHEPASTLSREVYRRMLAEPDPKGENVVLFLAGGAGSGKSSATRDIPGLSALKDKAQIVMDGTLSNSASSVAKIDQALAAGKRPVIALFRRDPVEAFNSVLDRAMAEGQGRTVPIKEFAKAHENVGANVRSLYEKYKDNPRVKFRFIDNSAGPGAASEKGLELTGMPGYTNLEGKLKSVLEERHERGDLTEAVYRGTLGDAVGRNSGSDNEALSNLAKQSDAKAPAPAAGEVKPTDPLDEYAKTYDSESVSEKRPAELGGGNFRDYLRQNDAIQLKNEKGMELWQASKDSNEFYLIEGDRYQTVHAKYKAEAMFNHALDEGTIFNRERAARNFEIDNPPEEAAPGAAAAETPAAQKTLGQLIKDLGRDLTPNEKGAVGNLGAIDEEKNARITENFKELVNRAKAQGYKTSEEIAAFASNNGMRGAQIQALMRQMKESAAAAAPNIATEGTEHPRPILSSGGGRRPPSGPPQFTVIPPHGEDPFQKYAGNINLQNLSLDEAAKQIIKETAQRDAPILDKARRGTISLEKTQELAKELGYSDKEVEKIKVGTALNAEEITAARTQLATYTKEVQDIAQNIGKGGDATADLIKLNQAIQKQASIQRVVSGVTAEAGRALNSMKILVSPENLSAKNMEAMLEALGGRQANVDLAKKLASIDPKDMAAVNAFIRDVSQPSMWDKVHEVWINAILSNPITHKTNIMSNLAFALSRVPEKGMTGLADAAIGLFTGKREVYAREVIPEAMGLFRGVGEGMRRMLYVIKNGDSIENMSKLERGGQEAIKGKIGKILRLPGTALVAEDEFAKGINTVMSRSALATRKAVSEGLSGKALSERIANLEAKPTSDMMEETEKEILYYTFQTPFGAYGAKISGLRQIPGVRYILPFLRTPLNIAKAGFERSPFGMAGLIPGAFRGEVSQAQVAQAISRSAIGSGIAGGLAYWTMRGNVTGRPPKEAGKRDEWYATGKIPYAFKVGGRWRSYQIEPFGAPVGALVDTLQDHIDKKKDISYEVAAYYSLNYAKAMITRSFLAGISNMFDALSDPERYADQQIAGFGSSAIPFSGTLRFITQSIDPIQRQAKTFEDGLYSTIPGLSTKVPAKLDVFGEPIKRPQRAYERLLSPVTAESDERNDPVRKMMEDVDYDLGYPAKSLNHRPMTDQEFNEYVSISGAEVRQNFELLAADGAYKGYDAKQIREMMKRYTNDARERARLIVTPKVEMRVLGVKADLTPAQTEDLGIFMSEPAYKKLETDADKKREIETFIGQAAGVAG